MEKYSAANTARGVNITNEKDPFLNIDDVDYVLADALLKFNYFSHEELSSAYQLVHFLFLTAGRPFTPFYDEGFSLNNQVRKGWIYQIKLLPPIFMINNSKSFREMIENKTKDICGDIYQAYKELLDDMSKIENKKLWLERMEKASVLYDELLDRGVDKIMDFETDDIKSKEHLRQIEIYVKKFQGC
jgi:hypothetical protein